MTIAELKKLYSNVKAKKPAAIIRQVYKSMRRLGDDGVYTVQWTDEDGGARETVVTRIMIDW